MKLTKIHSSLCPIDFYKQKQKIIRFININLHKKSMAEYIKLDKSNGDDGKKNNKKKQKSFFSLKTFLLLLLLFFSNICNNLKYYYEY